MKLETTAIQLRFVPLDRMLLHEEDDPYRVKRLEISLKHDGRLRNPPIVAEHGERYIVLDGATRTTALRAMGYRDVLVQIVDYYGETVQVSAWHHVLAGLPPNRLLAGLADVDGVTLQPVDPESACRMLATREIVASVLMRNGQWFAVLCEGDNNRRATLLCQMVAEYRGKTEVHRSVEADLPTLSKEYADLTAVIVFPSYSPAEITDIAINGAKVPMGITRHLVAGRALGLDIPLDMLSDSQTLEAKNAWLDDLIHKRLQANKIRLYQEPVFVFDE
ncbi:MAG: ParB N-terminal domain-containing protein [Chloroflexi bacterium]|nr:ParB N-terminal domain-containing protein [Chloroflexota bacterium]